MKQNLNCKFWKFVNRLLQAVIYCHNNISFHHFFTNFWILYKTADDINGIGEGCPTHSVLCSCSIVVLGFLDTVYPKKYAHGFVVLCFVVVMQSFIMNSHEVFIHIHQGCFAGTGAIVRLPQCQWSKPDGYGKISQCITTTKHSKAKTVCIFLGLYCIILNRWFVWSVPAGWINMMSF